MDEQKKIKVGVIGAAGFAGAELVRILLGHPVFDLVCITSDSEVGKPLSDLYPAFIGQTDLAFVAHDSKELYACDTVFLAVPHTGALEHAPHLLGRGINVLDLSADYRLDSAALYEHYYGVTHTSPDLLKTAVFGIPELYRNDFFQAAQQHKAGDAILVSCAGCYPTATTLAAYPAMPLQKAHSIVIVDAISGVTGAGKKATERTHFCFSNENVEAYAVTTHRHLPEIERILGVQDAVVFTPHLAPLNRGLLSTVTIPLAEPYSVQDIHARYVGFYEGCRFVEVLPLGEMPKTSSVAGTNKAHIGVAVDTRVNAAIAVSAIDNLGKGASAQAVQCANLIYGLDEGTGLQSGALPI